MWFQREKFEALAASNEKKNKQLKRSAFITILLCALLLLNAWSQSGMASPLDDYTFSIVPVSAWSIGKEEIPAAVVLPGQKVRCGNALWSYTRWKFGVVQIERCNY